MVRQRSAVQRASHREFSGKDIRNSFCVVRALAEALEGAAVRRGMLHSVVPGALNISSMPSARADWIAEYEKKRCLDSGQGQIHRDSLMLPLRGEACGSPSCDAFTIFAILRRFVLVRCLDVFVAVAVGHHALAAGRGGCRVPGPGGGQVR